MSIFDSKEAFTSFWTRAPLLASVRSLGIGLTVDERQLMARQLLTILDEYYVHLPQKISALAINPVQEARLLFDDAKLIPTDMEFFQRVLIILNKLRDRHTIFTLPAPWSGIVAFLPMTLEPYFDGDYRRMILSKLAGDVGDPAFEPGVEVTHWSGIPIGLYVQSLSWQTPGAHPFARIAIALRSLTVRPLAYMQPPDEDWVTLTYVSKGAFKSIMLPWKIYVPGPGSSAAVASEEMTGAAATTQGVDDNTLLINGTWHDIYAADDPSQFEAPFRQSDPLVKEPNPLKDQLLFRSVTTSHGRFGYVRIFSFDAPDGGRFVRDFAEILRKLPQNGLIIDLRANPGGNIPCGEALVQLFTDQPVHTAPVTFRNTPSVQRLVNALPVFSAWTNSVNLLLETGQTFSQGFSLTSSEDALAIGRVYEGQVALIIDSLCYSTTDFFVSDMQDNGTGKIIGTDPLTGAGGANVWTHAFLAQSIAASGGADVSPMPKGADMNIALRQALRVGPNAGLPLEGIGVRADIMYRPTRRDVLSKNEDLITFATGVLAES
jgi:hypothetical protein